MSLASDNHWKAFPTNRWKKELKPPLLENKPSYKKKLIKNNDSFEMWRRKVLERDGYRCIGCGTNGTRKNPLTVHHKHLLHDIAKSGEYPFDIDNGETLCRKCHDKEH